MAQTKLRRQTVKDLPSDIVAADALLDFKATNSSTSLGKEKKDWKKSNNHKDGSKGEMDCSDKDKGKSVTPYSFNEDLQLLSIQGTTWSTRLPKKRKIKCHA